MKRLLKHRGGLFICVQDFCGGSKTSVKRNFGKMRFDASISCSVMEPFDDISEVKRTVSKWNATLTYENIRIVIFFNESLTEFIA